MNSSDGQGANRSDAGVLIDLPGVVDVRPDDPTGLLPEDAKTKGIVVIIPRWPNFPTGNRTNKVLIYVVGIATPVATRIYGAADDAPEFYIPISPNFLPDVPSFEITYDVQAPNPTTSGARRLTFAVLVPETLPEPDFPDIDKYGWITCSKTNPQDPYSLFIWEGIRVEIPFDSRFQPLDVIKLEWQGWSTSYGAGTALTPLTAFSYEVSAEDMQNRLAMIIVIEPFRPHIEPMRNHNSASASYTVVRNLVPRWKSFTGLVKLDRTRPGETEYCDGPS